MSYRKNLDAAYLAAATTPGAANPITTAAEVTAAQAAVAALQPWTETAGIIQQKPGFGSVGCKVGSASVPVIRDAQDEFTDYNGVNWTSNGLKLGALTAFNAATPNTNSSSPYTVGASIAGRIGAEAWMAFDGLETNGHGWLAVGPSFNQYDLDITLGSARTFTSYRMRGNTSDGRYGPGAWKIYGYNGSWVEIDSRTGQTFGTSLSSLYTISTPGEYTAYRIHVSANQASVEYADIYELYYYEAVGASTTEMVTGTMSFDPAELYAGIDGGAVTKSGLTGKFNIAYSTNGGTVYSSFIDAAAFQALSKSIFAGLANLQLKIQPIGGYVINSIRLDTVSSGTLMATTGGVKVTVSGVDMIDLQADGDGVFTADLNADDITLTGDLTMDTTKTTIAQIAATTDTTSATTIKSIAVPADKTINIDADIIGNKAGASKAAYRILGTFYRNSTGNITQLGDTTVLQEGEVVAGWNVDFTLTQTPDYTVNIQVTGEASVAWSAKITYNLV